MHIKIFIIVMQCSAVVIQNLVCRAFLMQLNGLSGIGECRVQLLETFNIVTITTTFYEQSILCPLLYIARVENLALSMHPKWTKITRAHHVANSLSIPCSVESQFPTLRINQR